MFGRNHSFKSKKLRKKRRKTLLIKFVIILILSLTSLVIISWLSNNEKILISNIKIEGNNIISKKIIKNLAKEEISGKYFWLFPKNNIFLYPKKEIENNILENFPRISNSQVFFEDFNSILIAIKERKPQYTWCRKNLDNEKNKKNCYFVDKNGYIFSEAPHFSGVAFFEFYTNLYPDNSDNNFIGKFVLEKDIFGKIILFKNLLENFELEVIALEEGKDGDYEIFLKNGGKIIFNIEEDLDKILDNLKAVMGEEFFGKEIKNSQKKLEYIDLRYGNKVFYKFNN